MNAIAWGVPDLYELPDDRRLWGREFQLLPGGSMLRAGEVLHGLIGTELLPCGWGRRRGLPRPEQVPVLLCGIGLTDTDDLLPYRDELIAGMESRPENFVTDGDNRHG
jgi:hypothetical protein